MKISPLPEPCIKLSHLAVAWDCSPRFLKRCAERGDLERIRLGRDWHITLTSARRFYESRRVAT